MNAPVTQQLRQIDELCDRFEAEWRAGGRPDVADYLSRADPSVRDALRVELAMIENQLRRTDELTTTGIDVLSQVFDGSTMSELLGLTPHPAGPPPGDRSGRAVPLEPWQAEETLAESDSETTDFLEPTPGRASAGTAPADPEPSDEVAGKVFGRYILERKLAEGGMGVVYRARDRTLNRLVAIKTIKTGALATSREVRMFQREVEVVATLEHPNIVPVLDVGEQDGLRYFCMLLIDGKNLRERLEDFKSHPDRIARLVATLAGAMQYAHERGILHRDLKPSNVLVDAQDNPHLIDFGLALRVDAEGAWTITGSVAGTPCYMAPEQTTGRREETTVTDVYGLGTVLYSLLTARPPFQSSTALEAIRQVKDEEPLRPSRINPGVDRDLETICLKCLEKNPARRYQTARELAQDLTRYVEGEPILARPVSAAERAAKWVRRRPGTSGLLLALALAVGGGLGGVIHQWRQAVTARAGMQTAMLAAQAGEKQAREGEDLARRLEYVALLNLAGRDWRDANIEHLRRTLDETTPAPGRSDLRGFEWYFLDASRHRERLELRGHEGSVRGVAYRPGGAQIATCGDDQTVRLWNAADGRPVRSVPLGTGCLSLAFHPEGKLVAVGCVDGTLRLLDPDTGQLVRQIKGEFRHQFAVAFSPDGKLVAAAGRSPRVQVWSVADGQPFSTVEAKPGSSFLAIAFSPDGASLATASPGRNDGGVRVWDLAARVTRQTFTPEGTGVLSLAISPDGSRVASGGSRIEIWDARTGARAAVATGHGYGVTGLMFTKDGRRLVSTGMDQTVRVWEAETGLPLRTFKGHEAMINGLDLSPDGRSAASVGSDAVTKVWALDDPGGREFVAHDGQVTDLALSPDGSWLATGGDDRLVKIWDAAAGAPVRTLVGHTGTVRALSLRPDGSWLASASDDGEVRLWDVATGAPRRTLARDLGSLWCVEFSPDGKSIAAGGDRGEVVVWDPEIGEERHRLHAHTDSVVCLAFSPDGRTFATGGRDGLWRLWETSTGKKLLDVPQKDEMFTAVAFSPDGRRLLTGGLDRTIRVWDLATGSPLGVMRGHTQAVKELSFPFGGSRIVSAGRDGTLRVWDATLLRELLSIDAHAGFATSLAVSRDGRRVFTGGTDRFVRVWDATKAP